MAEFLDTMRKPLEGAKRVLGPYPYYGASGIVDYVDGYLFDEELVLLSEDGANITDRNYPVCFLASGKYWVNNHAHVLKPKSGNENNFICNALERKDYKQYNSGMAMPKLNQEVCRGIPVSCPSYNEQKKIGDFLRLLDHLITLHQCKCAEFRNLYLNVWEQRKLGEYAEIVGGGTPSTNISAYWDGDIDWYAPAEISDQIYLASSQRKITEQGINRSSAKLLPVGTVLFTSRAGIGKTAILSHVACTNQGFQSIVPHDGKLDSYFIFSRTEELKKYAETVGAGSTFVEVSGKQMSNMELMMPKTIEEQQIIGNYFSKIDNIITLHQCKCAKFRNSHHIVWEQRKLGEICSLITKGTTPKDKSGTGEVNFIKVENINPDNGEITLMSQISIEEHEGYLKRSKLEEGDILFSIAGTLGRVSVVKSSILPANTNQALAIIRVKDGYISYLTTVLKGRAVEDFIKRNPTVGAQPNLSLEQVSNLEIAFPKHNEQKMLGDYFVNLDALITLHQRNEKTYKKTKFQSLKFFVTGGYVNMNTIILYHGTPDREVQPQFGKGNEKHDYGMGFYLTESIELAKEWAVCRPNDTNGWVHKYELDTEGLKILDFQEHNMLAWLAELMKHRDAADSKRYRMLAKRFIDKYGIDTSEYDVIKGWRADASYFYIAKEFVRDNIDLEILEELLSLGGLGIQYCIKSELAYARLHELPESPVAVEYTEFNEKYNQRDVTARTRMRELVDSDANKVTKVFSTLIEE